jgi:hypothetical protein
MTYFWPYLLAYPKLIEYEMSAADIRLLNVLELLFPIHKYYEDRYLTKVDRYYTMSQWLELATVELGLITQDEQRHLRHIIAPLL